MGDLEVVAMIIEKGNLDPSVVTLFCRVNTIVKAKRDDDGKPFRCIRIMRMSEDQSCRRDFNEAGKKREGRRL